MSLIQPTLNNKQLFWQLILNINQYGVIAVTGFIYGWYLGQNLWSLLLFLFGLSFQLSVGFTINTKVIAVLDSIKKEKAELCLEEKRIRDIHTQLDELRDALGAGFVNRLIFEQDDKYWEILQQLKK